MPKAKQMLSTLARDSPIAFDAIIVGAGFAGMYMLHRLRKLGLIVRVYEQGGDVGGTWYWNRYPGARCDVESMQYSYSFSENLQQEWQWSERFATQPEILKYAKHVADRFDLCRDIQFETRVKAAIFDDAAGRWSITTSDGKTAFAVYFILATGCLSNAQMPNIRGRERFQGKTYHTAHWPHETVDFTGQRVIAQQASQLLVFQRTPTFTVPARNAALTPETIHSWKSNYAELRRQAREESSAGSLPLKANKGALEESNEDRQRKYEALWAEGGASVLLSYNDLFTKKLANDTLADFVRAKIADIVRDPVVAKRLQPSTYPFGTKRLCLDTDYYETFNRPNVTLVDIQSEPIEEILPYGLRTGGKDYELDAVVFATGFDAMTGSVAAIDIKGRNGVTLNQKWAEGPRTYLGLMSAGFPNLFIIIGPGSPSALSNVIVSIEQHVDWITDCIDHMRMRSLDRIEATIEAEDNWVEHVNEVAGRTLFPQANSWYMGANVLGKPRIFMPYIGGVATYRRICNDVVAKGYEGFMFDRISAVADSANKSMSTSAAD
jgi:cyclohexanone monooxygenase